MFKRVPSMRCVLAGAAVLAAGSVFAADPPKTEEVPFWAVGKPKADAGAKLAPVPSFPIATPADQLPVKKLKVPPGFKVEVWASNILDARGMRQGDKGTVFVSSLFVAGKIYAVTDTVTQTTPQGAPPLVTVPGWTDDGSIGHGGEQIGVYRLNANAPFAPMRAAPSDPEQTLE